MTGDDGRHLGVAGTRVFASPSLGDGTVQRGGREPGGCFCFPEAYIDECARSK